jgi:hypothetical protein
MLCMVSDGIVGHFATVQAGHRCTLLKCVA